MFRCTGWFRDFTCFAIFLVLFQALLQPGYAQQASVPTSNVTKPPTGAAAASRAFALPDAHVKKALEHLPVALLGSAAAIQPGPQRQLVVAASPAQSAPPQIVSSPLVSPAPAPNPKALVQTLAKVRAGTPEQAPAPTGRNAHRRYPYPITSFAKGAKPSGRSVKPHFSLNEHAVDDPADPYIVAQAQALNNDPAKIFQFVQNQVANEIYVGSLRGARGTLWSLAGNSLDKSSLLVALLKAAAGSNAGGQIIFYERTFLDTPYAQQLILSMFTTPSNVTGCPPAGSKLADPANDPDLLRAAQDHWLVSVNGVQEDPSFPGPTPPSSGFGDYASVPADQRHTVTFRLDIEQYSQASSAFGLSGISTTEVLNQQFDTAALVGKPVTVGNYVTGAGLSAAVFTSSTFTYSPYLRLPSDTNVLGDDQIISGQSYQETYTNFPLGSQILTGVFLFMDVTDASGNVETYQRDVLDRIGYAARQGGTSANISPPSPPKPALTPFDLQTVNVLGGLESVSTQIDAQALAAQIQSTGNALSPQFVGIDYANPTPAQQTVLQNAQNYIASSLVGMARIELSQFNLISDSFDASAAQVYQVKPYYTGAKLTIFSSQATTPSQGTTNLSLALDLRNDFEQATLPPWQVTNAATSFQVGRGAYENYLEGYILQNIVPPSSTNVTVHPTTQALLNMATASGTGLAFFGPGNPASANPSNYSPNAIARMDSAVAAGFLVIAPAKAILANGVLQTAWYEVDPSTGFMVGVTEDGGHQGLTDTSAEAGFTAEEIAEDQFAFGLLTGSLVGIMGLFTIELQAGFLCGAKTPIEIAQAVQAVAAMFKIYEGLIKKVEGRFNPAFLAGFEAGLGLFEKVAPTLIKLAPNGKSILCGEGEPPGPGPHSIHRRSQAGIGLQDTPIASLSAAPSIVTGALYDGQSTTPSGPLSSQLITDTNYGVQLNGALAPLAFQVTMQNGESVSDSFGLAISPVSGFSFEQSISAVSLSNGGSGEIGFCMVPTGSVLPPPGTQIPLNTTLTSKTNPSVTSTSNTTVTIPSLQGLSLSVNPQTASTTPGVATGAVLLLQGEGNVPTTAVLAITADAGLTITGINTPVTLNPGDSVTQNLTLTPDSSVPVGATLNATITASFGPAGSVQTVTAPIQVAVNAPQAVAIAAGTAAASAAGRSDIAATLGGISSTINQVLANCNTNTIAQLAANLNALQPEFNTTALQNVGNNDQLFRIVDNIQRSDCSNIQTNLAPLANLGADISTALSSAASFPFNLSLTPSTNTALAGQAVTYKVALQNDALVPVTYNLALAGIPAGVSGNLNLSSVTLNPGQSVPAGNSSDPVVSITQTGPTLQAFSFTVSAAISSVANSTQTTGGEVTLQQTSVTVQMVRPFPAFASAGTKVDVQASLVNVVNQPTAVKAVLVVKDGGNNTLFTSASVPATLSVSSLLTSLDFGLLDTTGFANGTDTLLVTVNDSSGNTLATGSGTLLIGSPVSAQLSVSPVIVPSGNSSVVNTLTVGSSTPPTTPLTLLANVATPSGAQSIAIQGNTAYSCDVNDLTVFDISTPSSPQLLTTVQESLIQNAFGINCNIDRGRLVAFADSGFTGNGNSPAYLAFDISTPTNPTLVTQTPFNHRFAGGPVFQGNYAFVPTNAVLIFGGFIGSQLGDIVSMDLTNFANPTVLGSMEQNYPGFGSPYGGGVPIYGAVGYNSNILYAGGTTSSGGNTNQGTGLLNVVSTSDPKNLTLLSQIPVPSSIGMGAPLIQGNIGVAIGNNGGTRNPFNSKLPGAVGNEVLTVYDLSNPLAPSVISSTVLPYFPGQGGGAAVIGPNLFLAGGVSSTAINQESDLPGTPVLLLIDTTNPANPAVTAYSLPTGATAPNSFVVTGNTLYATTGTGGFSVYQIPGAGLNGVSRYTATVQAENSANVAYDPQSFSIPPTSITPGSGVDTIEWDNVTVSTITWNSSVKGIQSAQNLPVAPSGTVSFTTTGGDTGSVPVGPTSVTGDQIISLSPATQTAFYSGQTVTYTVTLKNPTAAAVTYALSVGGIPANWVGLPATVTVAAGGAVPVTLAVTTDPVAQPGTYPFQVSAVSSSLNGSVAGTFLYQGHATQYPGVTNNPSRGLTMQATPATATAGPGTSATYNILVTNVGSTPEQNVFLATGGLPTGITSSFDQNSVTVQPGTDQGYTARLTMHVAPGTVAGPVNFQVQAYGSLVATANLTLNVISSGLTLAFQPSSTVPGGILPLTITNMGSAQDTFNLSLAGPLALSATLPASSVTLAAGASQVMNIPVGQPSFLAIGNPTLQAIGVSQNNTSVSANAIGTVAIGPTQGMTAQFQPASQAQPTSGAAIFPLLVQNTGTLRDSYSATVTGTTGQVTATITGLDGNPTQSVPAFILPGLGGGRVFVNLTPTGSQGGTATLKIQSLTNPTESVNAVATLTGTVVSPPQSPNASAGSNATIPLHRLYDLNASASSDPNSPPLPLTYSWTLASAPAGSVVTTAAIAFAGQAIAAFRPDVAGDYVFTVAVSNGQGMSKANVTLTASDLPPIAIAGHPKNAAVSSLVTLNGKDSYDPDGQSLSFVWTFVSVPAGSALTSASINNAQTPKPFFTPDVAGQYVVQLVVTDSGASSEPATVIITAGTGTLPPNADAGSDQSAAVGAKVTLNGSGSADSNVPALPLTYQWSFATVAAGSTLQHSSIAAPTTASPQFTPDVAGNYVMKLQVSNGQGTSQASVTVTAAAGNVAPNATAGPDQYASPNNVVNLTADGSRDHDNVPLPLAYLWWLQALPAGSAANIQNPDAIAAQTTPDKSGYYVARVEATDGLASGFANTLVTAAGVCDADANGVVNATDIALIQAAVGQTALPNDPADFNHDGTIDAKDVSGCNGLIGTQPPVLQVSPGSLQFQSQTGSPAPAAQKVTVGSSGAALSFSVSSNAAWLTASVASGSTDSINSVSINVNPAGLAVGVYKGVILFSPQGASAQSVLVTLTVSALPPSLTVSPGALQFSVAADLTVPPAQTLIVTSPGAPLQFSATSSQAWLSVTPTSGSTASGSLTVKVNPAGMASGVYNGQIAVTGPTNTVNVPVQMTIAQTVVTLYPLSLTFSAPGCTTPAFAQTISIQSSGAPVNFTARGNQPWMNVSPTSGSTAQFKGIQVGVDPSRIVPGTYNASVVVSWPGKSQTIPVTVTVGPANPLQAGPASLTFASAVGGAAPAGQSLTIQADCASLNFTAAPDQPWLSISTAAGSTTAHATVTVAPSGLAPNTYHGNIVITASGASNSPLKVPVTLVVSGPSGEQLPSISGVVNGASFVPGPVSGGSLVSIFGRNLTTITEPAVATQLPLPNQLGKVSVTINGVNAPLLYVSPLQINAQVPYEVQAGAAKLVLTTGGVALAPYTIQVSQIGPGLFLLPDKHAAAENQDFSANSSQNPVKPGAVILAYWTGQGALDNPVPTGGAAPASPLSTTKAAVTATIGGISAQVLFAGMTPGFAGLAQANIVVPDLAPGDYPLVLTAGGQPANAGNISVGK